MFLVAFVTLWCDTVDLRGVMVDNLEVDKILKNVKNEINVIFNRLLSRHKGTDWLFLFKKKRRVKNKDIFMSPSEVCVLKRKEYYEEKIRL